MGSGRIIVNSDTLVLLRDAPALAQVGSPSMLPKFRSIVICSDPAPVQVGCVALKVTKVSLFIMFPPLPMWGVSGKQRYLDNFEADTRHPGRGGKSVNCNTLVTLRAGHPTQGAGSL